jgi:hypothetical protein
MVAKFSFERLRSFPEITYDELFRKCEQALLASGLEVTRLDISLGILEARKKVSPTKSEHIFITIRRDSRVTAIEKSDMNPESFISSSSSEEMITAKFFRKLKELV